MLSLGEAAPDSEIVAPLKVFRGTIPPGVFRGLARAAVGP